MVVDFTKLKIWTSELYEQMNFLNILIDEGYVNEKTLELVPDIDIEDWNMEGSVEFESVEELNAYYQEVKEIVTNIYKK